MATIAWAIAEPVALWVCDSGLVKSGRVDGWKDGVSTQGGSISGVGTAIG